jgi:hypothetical protein
LVLVQGSVLLCWGRDVLIGLLQSCDDVYSLLAFGPLCQLLVS